MIKFGILSYPLVPVNGGYATFQKKSQKLPVRILYHIRHRHRPAPIDQQQITLHSLSFSIIPHLSPIIRHHPPSSVIIRHYPRSSVIDHPSFRCDCTSIIRHPSSILPLLLVGRLPPAPRRTPADPFPETSSIAPPSGW